MYISKQATGVTDDWWRHLEAGVEVTAHLAESGVVVRPEVETRLLAAPLTDGEGVGLARVWSWRGCGPGEGVGLARAVQRC